MHENAIKKIEGIIVGSLKRCEVVDNWPQFESFTKHIESLAKEVLKHKSEWLTLSDVYSIYYDLVYEEIIETINQDDKYTGKLLGLIEEVGILLLSTKLSGFF